MKALVLLLAGFVSVFLLTPAAHSASPQAPCYNNCKILTNCMGSPCYSCTQCFHTGTGFDTCTRGGLTTACGFNCWTTCTLSGLVCNCP